MFNKAYFIENLKRIGLKETDTVLVHSSYKKIAGDVGVEGRADTVIDAFMEYFGDKGLVVFPTLSYKLGYMINDKGQTLSPALGRIDGFREYGNHYDVRHTPTHGVGILPELFRQRDGVVRSLSPSSSVAAFGPDAKEFCAGHEKSIRSLSWDTPWGKLYDRKAKTLFLGTNLACNTMMHAIEDYAEIPGLLGSYIWEFTLTDYEGRISKIAYKRHEGHHNWYYDNVRQEFLEKGIAKKVMFGSAESYLVDVVTEVDYMLARLKETPELFTKEYNEKR